MKGTFILPNGQKLTNVHSPTSCKGPSCTIHGPSDHHMIGWPLEWEDLLGFVRVCPHGKRHPDPDGNFDIQAFHSKAAGIYANSSQTFGCPCGCCLRTHTSWVLRG